MHKFKLTKFNLNAALRAVNFQNSFSCKMSEAQPLSSLICLDVSQVQIFPIVSVAERRLHVGKTWWEWESRMRVSDKQKDIDLS